MSDEIFKPLPSAPAPGRIESTTPRMQKHLWDTTGRKFLKGPIPVEWLTRAYSLGFAALGVGLECWFLAGVNRSPSFRLNLSRLKVAPKMARSSVRRGLRSLEEAGLVSTARPAGQRVLVAIKPYAGVHEEHEQDRDSNGVEEYQGSEEGTKRG